MKNGNGFENRLCCSLLFKQSQRKAYAVVTQASGCCDSKSVLPEVQACVLTVAHGTHRWSQFNFGVLIKALALDCKTLSSSRF
eukprot:5735424-Amphidinium_carterae.1